MSAPSRREFISQAILPGIALLLPAALAGPLLAAPKPVDKDKGIDLRWRDESERIKNVRHEQSWFILDLGIGETHCFTRGLSPDSNGLAQWNIRCGSIWRPGELFHGTVAEAKGEAERFTRECLVTCLVAVEKVVFDINGSKR
jgi:hypothetical protein